MAIAALRALIDKIKSKGEQELTKIKTGIITRFEKKINDSRNHAISYWHNFRIYSFGILIIDKKCILLLYHDNYTITHLI